MSANMGIQVHFIEEHRFYKLADAGKGRTPAKVGDEVSFWFPHDTRHGSVGVVTSCQYVNGREVYSIRKMRERSA